MTNENIIKKSKNLKLRVKKHAVIANERKSKVLYDFASHRESNIRND